MRNLIREVHRRSLWQVLGIYFAGSWVALQVVEQLAEATGLPPWVRPLALALLVIGLPVVLATAFVQEGIHARPERDDEARGGAATARTTDGVARVLTWRNAMFAAGGALALWGLVAAGWLFFGGSTSAAAGDAVSPSVAAAAGTDRPEDDRYAASVAVMPFENLGDAADEPLSDGFTEEVIAQLARIERLKVISRTSVVAIRDANLTLPEIGDTLGVEHVLRGSVRGSGDQIRVTVELMRAASDAIEWVETYTRAKANIFELEDEIAGRVSSALIENVAELAPTGGSTRMVSSDAYEAYLRGRRAIHDRTGEAFTAAIAAFREAIEADSAYAPAYAGLAAAYGLSITYGFEMDLTPYERSREALALSSHAIELDPDLAEAYGTRSYIEVKSRAPVEIPLADVERAVELLPNSADMRGWYAHSLSRAGRHAEAMAEAQLAIELDPIAPGRRNGSALDAFAAREYQVSLEEARSALALQPELLLPKEVAAYALLLMRRPAECLQLGLPDENLARATCMQAAGEGAAAEQVVDATSRLARGQEGSLTDMARAGLAEGLAIHYAQLGDADASLAWYELAFDLSPDGIDFRFYDGGLFDEVRATGRYEERVGDIWREAWGRVSGEAS